MSDESGGPSLGVARKKKIAIGVIFMLSPNPEENSRFQDFFFSHFPLFESHMNKLKSAIEQVNSCEWLQLYANWPTCCTLEEFSWVPLCLSFLVSTLMFWPTLKSVFWCVPDLMRWVCQGKLFTSEIWIDPKFKLYTLCNEQSYCQIDWSIWQPCVCAVLFTGVCSWHCQSSGWLPVLPSTFPFAPRHVFSLTNYLLHLSSNLVCQLQCQISQSVCVLCHSQGHEDESAVSWCQPEGLGLQPNGGWAQRVQVGQQLTLTHYDTDNNLT